MKNELVILVIVFIVGGVLTLLHTKWYKIGQYLSIASFILVLVYIVYFSLI